MGYAARFYDMFVIDFVEFLVFSSTGVLAIFHVILMTGKAARKEVDSQSGRRLQTTVLSIEV